MSNPTSIFLVILYISYGLQTDQAPPTNDDSCKNGNSYNICGRWFAVMGTGCNDGGPCYLFKNNKPPACKCLGAYFYTLESSSWEVYLNAYNSENSEVTVHQGGCSSKSTDNKQLKCFVLSEAKMDQSVISKSPCFLSDKVAGVGSFCKYEIDIIGYCQELKYMITRITIDGRTFIIIWFRSKYPSRNIHWTAIVQNLKKLDIDAHKLIFYPQENCTHPKMVQCDEMNFCQ